MPLPDKTKFTIRSAIHYIENTITIHYPRSFPTIEHAKTHISTICAQNNFDYGIRAAYNLRPTDPHQIVRLIKDKVCFLVAVRAHDQGEFYLDKALPDRQVLRDAIESDITRIMALFPTWPTEFLDADVAAKYVAGVCALKKFVYTLFEGVTAEKFRGYVTFNTARHAWEGRLFELKVVPREWVRTVEKKEMQQQMQPGKKVSMQKKESMLVSKKANPQVQEKEKTLKDTIEADIQRLSKLIPSTSWPSTFADLNAARNFVGAFCYDIKFKYIGWQELERKRYMMFVNYNTAKHAFEDGVFKIEKTEQVLKNVDASKGRVGTAAQTDDVKIAEVVALATEKPEETQSHEGTGDCDEVLNAAEAEIAKDSCDPTGVQDLLLSDEDTKAPATDNDTDIEAASDVQKQAVPIDPFKNLVDELQRGYLLKAAFE